MLRPVVPRIALYFNDVLFCFFKHSSFHRLMLLLLSVYSSFLLQDSPAFTHPQLFFKFVFFFLLPHYVSSSKFLFVSRLKKKSLPSWVKIHNRKKKSQTFPPQKTTQELVVAVYWARPCGHFLTTWVFYGWKRHQKKPRGLARGRSHCTCACMYVCVSIFFSSPCVLRIISTQTCDPVIFHYYTVAIPVVLSISCLFF